MLYPTILQRKRYKDMKRRMITVMLAMITVTLNGCNYNRHATAQENAIESGTRLKAQEIA